ncbi:sensory transduction regulatory protein [hydrocarbon metagenome]|uniref:Sensory transduction regulatory protein n=1 Tax=hydrocarbon metagenome TaxID=938273 RepID=A0A0W8FRC8_9ZZZZ
MSSVNGKRCDKIMVVEDEWIVADQLCNNLKELGYMVCATASTGDEAIRNVKENNPDLILMDIVLKNKMDGIEAAEQITSQFSIPVIYLTSYTNREYIERAKQTKPFGYLVKPFKQGELYANIEMALHKHRLEKEIKEYLERLVKCYRGTIENVSGAIELRGPYSPGHHRRVAEFAQAIAGKMGLSDFSIEGTCLAAYVYDVGLVCIPLSVIQESGQLTGLKLNLYRSYPKMSYEILEKIDFPWPVADIVLQHCECYDGSGFPKGIKKNDILIEARVLAVAHALEDLTSHKSFRNAFPMNQALDEIKFCRESKYDPNIVDISVRLFRDK